jgi:hypothetical protein
MPLKETDLIFGRREFDSIEVAVRVGRGDDNGAFLEVLQDEAIAVGIDPAVPTAMWLVETADGTSPRWVDDLNPAGIGIVSNSTQQTFHVPNVQAAAALLIHALYALVKRKALGAPLWGDGQDWIERVWLPKVQSEAMPDVLRVSDLGLRYTQNGRPRATWSWEDGKVPEDTYGKKLVARMARFYPGLGDQVRSGESVRLISGRVPRPEIISQIANKPSHQGSGYGYDYSPVKRNPFGMVWHEWMGNYIAGFFSCPNGERCGNALVDFAILKDGTIIMLNDPFGQRAPWASGGGVGLPGGLEGDGIPFVSKYGVAAINRDLVSVEIVKLDNENWTEAQVLSAARLGAWIHDRDGQAWNEHPYTSKRGLVTSFLHYEFGTTSCGKGEVDDLTRCQAATRQIMRAHQENVDVPEPLPPNVPPLPEPELPGGISLEEAKRRFGVLRRQKIGSTKITEHGFDRNGVISLAWAHRCAQSGIWPQADRWYQLEDNGPMDLVTFKNDWRMMQVAERQGMQWVDFVPAVR